jgi:agmatinase
MSTFDPNAAAAYDGIFGLPHEEHEAKCVLIAVPFEATTSYRPGTKNGPQAILEASAQVDLYDVELGRVYEPGIHLVPESDEIRAWSDEARAAAEPIIEAGGVIEGDEQLVAALASVNERSAGLNAWVYGQAKPRLAAGKIVGVVGGDHSTPFGLIQAVSEQWPGVGILHVDAHADLRAAYEGFAWSHASIMHNVATRLPGVAKLVQVGIRDFCEAEVDFIRDSHGRIVTHFDAKLARERSRGVTWQQQIDRILEPLPQHVYVSFDIDGLDPELCPATGTPVPGGLSFHEATLLISAIALSGRKIVAFDLNEVAPGPDGEEWNGNVAARLLYKLIGWTFASQGLLKPL